MGESRQELLQWLNGLLDLNLTRVEQCGTGAAYCQVFDSIYLDVAMAKVKFNVNSEYMYLNNFKILQNSFQRHHVDHPIPVEALTKCKMQDNLEFLQWVKKYWDQHFPGIEYDPVSRRKASGAPAAPAVRGGGGMRPAPTRAPMGAAAGSRRPVTSNTAAARAPRPGSAASSSATAAVQAENTQLKETVEGLERERDFYFAKLRDIEVMLQQEVEANPALEQETEGLIPRMQAVLYSTEDGFEIPDEAVEGEVAEEETF